MKVNVLAENLKKGLSIVARGISSRVQLPILSSVLLKASKEGLVLSATDLEISIRVKVRAKVEEPGEIALPGKLFGELVATLASGAIELRVEKQTLVIEGEGVRSEVVGQGAEEFPVLPEATGKGLELSGEELKQKLSMVTVSAAKDDTRPVLGGVLWVIEKEKIELVATDGYRLGIDSLKIDWDEENKKVIIPARALHELSRIVDNAGEKISLELDESKQQVLWVVGEVELSSRLIVGEFPPYLKAIPAAKTTTLRMDKDSLIDAVKRASLFAKEGANVIRFEVSTDDIEVVAANDQRGTTKSKVNGTIEGEEVRVAFNAKYLIEYLNNVDDEEVIMETEGELKPAVFKPIKGNFIHIIMPVRINN